MIVVDVNVLAYLHLAGDHTSEAEQALIRDPEWAAPGLWRSEFRNVLVLYVRKRILTLSDARTLMNSALELMEGHEFEVDSGEVFDVLGRTNLSAYDAEYAALAETLDVRLVTADRRLCEAIPLRAISLIDFAATG
jgi:predicted nucleic acid-binding protein